MIWKINPVHLLSNEIFPPESLRRLFRFRKNERQREIDPVNVYAMISFFTELKKGHKITIPGKEEIFKNLKKLRPDKLPG